MPKKKKEPAKRDPTARPTIVGIGASAGGIEALQEFFRAVPADLNLAYVVVVHLSPHHESELAAILGRCTTMDVVEVRDEKKLNLESNCVYVISPDRKLEISDKTIGAAPFAEARGPRTAIDVFFRSLANHGDGFAVILSGGGADGVVGAKGMREAGGVVLVQDPREAIHEGMPRAAIAAGIADVVLPVRELAARLGELARHKEKLAALIHSPGRRLRSTRATKPSSSASSISSARARVTTSRVTSARRFCAASLAVCSSTIAPSSSNISSIYARAPRRSKHSSTTC